MHAAGTAPPAFDPSTHSELLPVLQGYAPPVQRVQVRHKCEAPTGCPGPRWAPHRSGLLQSTPAGRRTAVTHKPLKPSGPALEDSVCGPMPTRRRTAIAPVCISPAHPCAPSCGSVVLPAPVCISPAHPCAPSCGSGMSKMEKPSSSRLGSSLSTRSHPWAFQRSRGYRFRSGGNGADGIGRGTGVRLEVAA